MKTVIFDETKWQIVPKETTQEMDSVYANEYCVYQTAQELHDQMLRASPPHPEVEPLTNEEIKRHWSGGACPDWAIKFARAILAAAEAKRGA